MANQSRCTKYIENVEKTDWEQNWILRPTMYMLRRGRTNPQQCLNNVKNSEDPVKRR